MRCQHATPADADALARMNQALIRDEGHRNRMTLAELTARMSGWLAGEYEAVLFLQDESAIGYALFKREAEFVYLRQFFIEPACRRRGLGREALAWLRASAWRDCPRVRVEVLVSNAAGVAFWRAVGFADYCLTLEREQ